MLASSKTLNDRINPRAGATLLLAGPNRELPCFLDQQANSRDCWKPIRLLNLNATTEGVGVSSFRSP